MKNNARTAGILIIVSGGLGAIGIGLATNYLFFGWIFNLLSNIIGYSPQDFSIALGYSLLAFPAGVAGIILGIYLIKRRSTGLAAAGTVASMIAFFPCGIAALIFVIKARSEFYGIKQEQTPEAEILIPAKKKSVALLLAIFFGPFAWLYTYRRDALKAAIGLGLAVPVLMAVVGMPLIFTNFFSQLDPAPPHYFYYILVAIILLIMWLPLWLWAVVDMATAGDWYLDNSRPRSKVVAILLAVLLSPWTFFYTYKKDALKFWLSLLITQGIGIASLLLISRMNINLITNTRFGSWQYYILQVASSVISLAIMVTAILVTALRSKEWYDNYHD